MLRTDKLSLGEGNTPLIRLYNLEKRFATTSAIWAKLEFTNPTGSFKDRGSVAEVRAAVDNKKNGLVCASTGNMAASLASYAARAGLRCVVFVPRDTPIAKLQQATMAGAEIQEAADNYDQCVEIAKKFAKQKNFQLCGDYQIRRKGQTTVGQELANSGVIFDSFIVPVGNGTLGVAIAEGLAAAGQRPRFIGVQGVGADPIFQAWSKNSRTIQPQNELNTSASAMKVGKPLDGQLVLSWVEKTKGRIYAVTDQEIQTAQKILAQVEGIFVEKSAAATLGALQQFLISGEREERREQIVLILSGSGLKEQID